MNKTRFQKVNRAAVASVLAASGTVAVLPINDVKAASPFTDVDPAHFAYDAIVNLYERNIISGYGNGKFGPNDSVTRGQAAKMLAQVLELDTSSVVNPNFKDVKPTDPFYKYIAALANAGVINGFVDQTYRPNEPITRGQMAIVITRGFNFKQATLPMTHSFEDVTLHTYEHLFIQTIYDLGITKGTTERTFEPYSRVSRGQMAVFINRAENVRATANPVYEVTNVHAMGNITYAYVNGIKHTVDSRLKNIFNEANAAVLEGAIIEGDISDTKRIVSLSKITFTASGSQGRSLQFNGRDSVFAGDVAITGSYIKFRNWSVTGEVSIEPETIRTVRAAIEASPFKRVASLGSPFGFIDWGQQTDPDDYEPIGGGGGNGDPWTGPADGSEDGTDLVSPPTGNESGYYKRMTPVHRYIEFLDTDIRYLVIRQTGTHVTSTNTLPHVTVTGNVKAYELYANIETMYIETDVNTKMYGISEIEEVYKNSHKSVDLDADTTIDLMIVDNSNGWIDLGEHAYIHKVIIPPNKMPNDIFNDFINDNDLIGDIEDPSGEDVDRDPIENTIIPDLEDPKLSIIEIETELDTATITFNSNEDGMLYYVVKKEKDGEPSIREIMQSAGSRWSGRAAVAAGRDKIIEITQLDDQTEYVVYAVVVDEAGNISDKTYEFFRITDASPPMISPVNVTPLAGGRRAEVTFNPNETGEYFYYYEEYSFGDEIRSFTSAEIIERANDGRPRTGKGNVTTPGQTKFMLRDLDASTQYIFYMVMQDETGNTMFEPVVSRFETLQLDDSHPFVTDETLYLIDKRNYVFELSVSEVLDPERANDINNYVLSGTGIVNVTGQTTIKPDFVEYVPNSRKIRVRIPSASGFVDGDTLTVTILPGVTDLAENEFENTANPGPNNIVENSATYRHNDNSNPILTIKNLATSSEGNILEYDSTKAGTMYYMILADSIDIEKTTPLNFYNYIVGIKDLQDKDTGEEKFAFDQLISDSTKEVLTKFGGQSGDLNTVVVGTQTHNFVTPTNTDPFLSYSIHMVVRDRSGKLSTIQSRPLVNDKKAPFIKDIKVDPIDGFNNRTQISLTSSESGTLYYRAVPKYLDELDAFGNKIPNPEIATIEGWKSALMADKGSHQTINSSGAIQALRTIRDSWSKEELKKSTSFQHTAGLKEHTDYVYYFAAEDANGNFTMFPASNTPNEYGDDLMQAEVYTDGIKPKVLDGTMALSTKFKLRNGLPDPDPAITLPSSPITGPITIPTTNTHIGNGLLTYVEQQTFVITFSEAIIDKAEYDAIKADATKHPIPYYYYKTPSVQKETLMELKDLIEAELQTVDASLGILDIEWEKNWQSINSWDERRLIFTVNKKMPESSSSSPTVTLEKNDFVGLVDLSGKTIDFDAPIKYEGNVTTPNTYLSAVLQGNIADAGNGYFTSQNLLATLQIWASTVRDLEYFYVTQNVSQSGTVIEYSAEDIINYVESASLSPSERAPYDLPGAFVSGKGKIDPSAVVGSTGSSFQVELRLTGNNTFTTQQPLFLVTRDKYGNILASKMGTHAPGALNPNPTPANAPYVLITK